MNLRAGPASATDNALEDWNRALLGALLFIGDRNGLFAAMADSGPATPTELARRTGQSARYLQEWLAAMACAGYAVYDTARGTFALAAGRAAHLADLDRLFSMLPTLYSNASGVARSFFRGTGVPHAEYGPDFWDGYERFARVQLIPPLTREWIPAMDGIEASLTSGGRVAVVGCGNGEAVLALAGHYPATWFAGYDRSAVAVETCRNRAAALRLGNRAVFEQRDVSEGLADRYDLICALDIVHSLPDPLGVLASIREALMPEGALLWAELDVSGDLGENIESPVAQFGYGLGTLYCLTTTLAEGGAGLGACLGPEGIEDLARRAGFTRITRLNVEHPFMAAYEVRQ